MPATFWFTPLSPFDSARKKAAFLGYLSRFLYTNSSRASPTQLQALAKAPLFFHATFYAMLYKINVVLFSLGGGEEGFGSDDMLDG